MTEAMYILYQYAHTQRMSAYLLDEEYRHGVTLLERQREKLSQALPEQERPRLSHFLEDLESQHDCELAAAFQSGFSLAWELLRS